MFPQLKISVTNPCTQQWSEMENSNSGKYCQQCSKDVIDMTAWSDQQLIDFFHNNTGSVCGRINASSVNRELQPNYSPTNRIRMKYRQVIAFVLSFFSLNTHMYGYAAKHAGVKKEQDIANGTEERKQIMISGNVKDDSKKNMSNLKFEFLNEIYCTDSLGNFEITIDSSAAKAGLLVIEHPVYNRVVLNYHPAMKSMTYQIEMELPRKPVIMGGITMCSRFTDTIFVKLKHGCITTSVIQVLASFGSKLRNNPSFQFEINSNYTKKTGMKAALKNAFAVKNYLMKNEGIDSQRLLVREPKLTSNKQDLSTITLMSRQE